MELQFQLAKNNEKTVTVNNFFLHSSYNPSNEAKRFVELISIPFNPKYIIVIEPAISYCLPYLREKFPHTKIGVIRFSKDFIQFNSNFDFYIDYINNITNFENYLYNFFNESQFLQTFIVSWKNSEKVFNNDFNTVTVAIKKVLQKAKTILITRQYFEKKWLLNSVMFCKYAKKFISPIIQINKPILIFSSGPSSFKVLPYIKKNRNQIFLICLSSAISILDYYQISPDLYMSTDGGYWAGQHLKKIHSNIPLALPIEAFCSKSTLQKQKILPLIYSDSLLANYLINSKIQYTTIQRNGTIAGTAIEFALSLNNYPLFITGIDLCTKKGFQHTQPNELEINNSLQDNKLFSKETRLSKAEFNSNSFDIYKSWFDNFQPYKTIYRIIENVDKSNILGQIKDISSQDFENKISVYKKTNNSDYSNQNKKINLSNLLSFINNLKNTDLWEKQLFPLDLVSLSHNNDNNELKIKLKERSESLYQTIRTIIND